MLDFVSSLQSVLQHTLPEVDKVHEYIPAVVTSKRHK